MGKLVVKVDEEGGCVMSRVMFKGNVDGDG